MRRWGVEACPGVLLVWCGRSTDVTTVRIPADGLTLGRDLLLELGPFGAGDDRISKTHARVAIEKEKVAITDEASRNGTYVNGYALGSRKVASRFPAVVRTGHSVWVVVDDIARYEGHELVRKETLAVRSTLAAAFAGVEAAGVAGRNLVLRGAFSIGRELATRYARSTGSIVRIESGDKPLASAIGNSRAKTIAIELTWSLAERDIETLRGWIASGRRIAVLTRDPRWVDRLPQELAPELVVIPELRLDELTATTTDTIHRTAQGVDIHATVIEAVLCRAISGVDEDTLMRLLEASVQLWRERGVSRLTGEDLYLDDDGDLFERCVIIHNRRPPRAPARSAKPSGRLDTAVWAARRLCPDGACTGLIGSDNACRICGKTVPLDDPYR